MKKKDINRFVLGTAQFGSEYGISNTTGRVPKNVVKNIMEEAYLGGIRSIETASAYAQSERLIGNSLVTCHGNDWTVYTKIRSADGDVCDAVKTAINLLKQKPKGVLAHQVSDYVENRFFRESLWRVKETFDIDKIGVSVYTEADVDKVMRVATPDIIQLPLNILDTRLLRTGKIEYLKSKGVEIHARSVFLQGLLYLEQEKIGNMFPSALKPIKILNSLALSNHLTLPEFALQWVMSVPGLDKVLIGVQTVNQLRENLKHVEASIDERSFLKVLDVGFDNCSVLDPSLWLN